MISRCCLWEILGRSPLGLYWIKRVGMRKTCLLFSPRSPVFYSLRKFKACIFSLPRVPMFGFLVKHSSLIFFSNPSPAWTVVSCNWAMLLLPQLFWRPWFSSHILGYTQQLESVFLLIFLSDWEVSNLVLLMLCNTLCARTRVLGIVSKNSSHVSYHCAKYFRRCWRWRKVVPLDRSGTVESKLQCFVSRRPFYSASPA